MWYGFAVNVLISALICLNMFSYYVHVWRYFQWLYNSRLTFICLFLVLHPKIFNDIILLLSHFCWFWRKINYDVPEYNVILLYSILNVSLYLRVSQSDSNIPGRYLCVWEGSLFMLSIFKLYCDLGICA